MLAEYKDQGGHLGKATFDMCVETDGSRMRLSFADVKCQRRVGTWSDYNATCGIEYVDRWEATRNGEKAFKVAERNVPYPGPGTYEMWVTIKVSATKHEPGGWISRTDFTAMAQQHAGDNHSLKKTFHTESHD
ncbi:hypothetical protein [Kitasatospora sp. NPDC089509]|uniref:hypothetical protein n=1 Tax=Kitasatospora sp. NPDC089509 TaxID=3364079 RepID=UPI00381591C1